MLTPSKQVVHCYIESLEKIRDCLILSDKVAQAMLVDALENKLYGGLHGTIQQDLLLLNTAKQQIEKVIATLLNYQQMQ